MRIRRGLLAPGCLLVCAFSQCGAQGVVGSVGAISMGMGGVKGQPYSLVETTTTVRTLGDGTTITNHQGSLTGCAMPRGGSARRLGSNMMA